MCGIDAALPVMDVKVAGDQRGHQTYQSDRAHDH